VIDRRAHDGEAERHVDRAAEGDQLDGDQPLVVIAGNHGVEFAAHGAAEDRVAGKRAVDLDAARARRLDGRPQDAVLFRAEQPFLAGVRVQAGERDARTRDAEARELARGQVDDVAEQRPGEKPRHLGERDVHRRQDDLQRLRPEHHGDARRAREMRQQVGVPLPVQPGA